MLKGTAAGSLGPDDLAEIGITAAAVDIVELALGLGLESRGPVSAASRP